jgi:alcohol dehydrogenase class IV
MKERLLFGCGCVNDLKKYLKYKNPRSIMLLHGRASYDSSGAAGALAPIMNGYSVFEWSGFSANPTYPDLLEGIEAAKQCDPDLIIAVGGGSVMDMGKLVGLFYANLRLISDKIFNIPVFEENAIPMVAIPTTTGTGSEATHFAVLWHDREKFSIAHDSMLPDLAIVDPSLVRSQPKYLMISSALDALSQGIESYWSIYSTDESKRYAKDAIAAMYKNLSSGCPSREDMAMGAYMAGKAINITKTTAPHAVSYALTGYYNIPHGNAVFLTLPSFFEYNYGVTEEDCLDARGAEYVRRTMEELADMLGAKSIPVAVNKLNKIFKDLNVNSKLSYYGVNTEDDISCIVKNGFNPQRVDNNPRRLTKKTLQNILESLM